MKKKILSVVLALILCFSATSISAETVGETASKYLIGLLDIIANTYKYGIEKEELYKVALDYLIKENPEELEGTLSAATDILDDYSVYYNSDELSSFVTNVQQTYVGIGVTVQKSSTGCTVIEVNESGGAFEAGIREKDTIVAVNGTDIKDMSLDEIVSMIQGDAGTNVSVTITRGEQTMTLDVTRKKIIIKSVSYEIKDGIGYIKIDSFASATSDEVKAALYEIEKVNKLNKIIIDVRDNPGGELGSVVKVLDQFVPKNKILVMFDYKVSKYDYEIPSKAPFTKAPNRKIVILANENSASAAELFTATMKHYKLATVIGKRTFGKGSMQEMLGIVPHPNIDLGDIKLTTAEFTGPDGAKINNVGVQPDIRIQNKFVDFDESQLTPMTISARYQTGDEHSDVLAIEERLDTLGYNAGDVDGVFDDMTHQATMSFQANNNLYPYGVMDYTTQSVLNDAIDKLEIEVDIQLEEAFKFLKK